MSSLVQRLKAECKQSPGKAAVLGVLLVVAAWVFWPKGKHEPQPVQAAAAGRALPTGVSAPPLSVPKEQKPQLALPWQDWVHQVDKEPWMRPFLEALQNEDAFAPLVQQTSQQMAEPQVSETESQQAQDEPPPVPSWQLSGVSLGPGRSVALIDGRAYLRGDALRWQDQVYILRRITRHGVVLENQEGQTLELKLLRPKVDQGVQLRRVPAAAARAS